MKNLENLIRSHNWWIGEAPAYLATVHPFVRGFVGTPKHFKVGYTKVFLVMKNDYAWQILDKDESLRVSESLLNDYAKSPQSIKRKITHWQKIFDQFIRLGDAIDQKDLDRLPLDNLLKIYKKYFDEFVKAWTTPLILESNGIYSNEIIFPQFVKSTGLDKKRAYNVFATLATPVETSFAASERLSLLRIIDKSYDSHGKINPKSAPQLWKALESHAASFYYVHNNYQRTQKLMAGDFAKEVLIERKTKSRLKIRAEIRALENAKNQLLIKKRELVKNLAVSGQIKKILEGLALFGWWQDERKKMTLIGNYYILLFVKKIAKRLNLPYEELAYALPEELVKSKSRQSLRQVLRGRRAGCLLYETVQDLELILTGREAAKLIEFLLPVKKEDEFKLEGIVASRGADSVVQGKVRIVLDPNKDPFEEGEILVTGMTRPEFVILMRKARGVITNEGGITSHAAIIAREFGIPAIVGTKEATHVLQSGDFVEMRMNHGVVLRLSGA